MSNLDNYSLYESLTAIIIVMGLIGLLPAVAALLRIIERRRAKRRSDNLRP
jgi:hypothetical protein